MITNKRSKLALIHVAKREVGLSEDRYRDLLAGAAGLSSAREIEREEQFRAIMNAFKALGFNSIQSQQRPLSRPAWADRWGCNDAQRAKIEVMWRAVARDPGDRALHAFIRRITGVDHPQFLRDWLAQNVIIALSAMMKQVGLDPTTGKRLEPKQ